MSNEPESVSAGSGFHRLLARLDPEPARAEQEFERLRRALERFFDWRGAPYPEDCADEALSRLAKKLEEGVAVLDVPSFAHGIARLVLMENARDEARLTRLDDVGPPPVAAPPNLDEEARTLARYLDDCLVRFSPEERDLVLAYYAGGSGRAKIERRRQLARESGLSDNALRSRVQRLRDRLEVCVRGLLSGSSRGGRRS